MSIKITEDSAAPLQAYNLTLAFQRTAGLGLPEQITTEPTVTVAGSCMGWTSPGMGLDRAVALLAEYDRLARGVFDGPLYDPRRTVRLTDVAHTIKSLMSEDGENPEYDRACTEIAADLGIALK